MIRKILVYTLLFISVVTNAQEATYSPYSLHGIGLTKFRGTVSSLSMAGLTIVSDPVTPNLANPATYAELKQTNFSIGGTYSSATIKSSSAESKGTATSFDYLAISIPADKFGFGFGLVPVTASGYRINQVVASGTQTQIGRGGVNRVYFGAGAEVYKGLKLGAEFRYNFGRIENEVTLINSDSNVENTRTTNQSDLKGVSYMFSAIYDNKIIEKYKLKHSISYEVSNRISSENNRLISGVSTATDGTIIVTTDSENVEVANRSFRLPSRLTLGTSLSKQGKWLVAGEAYLGDNNDFQDRFETRERVGYAKPYGAKLGGYFQPNFQSLNNYFERIIYRGGIRFDRTGLVFNNEDINEFGISFGLSFPLRRGLSTIDFGFEVGKRGTTNSGAVEENFLNFSLGLSLTDKWFRKRKYD